MPDHFCIIYGRYINYSSTLILIHSQTVLSVVTLNTVHSIQKWIASYFKPLRLALAAHQSFCRQRSLIFITNIIDHSVFDVAHFNFSTAPLIYLTIGFSSRCLALASAPARSPSWCATCCSSCMRSASQCRTDAFPNSSDYARCERSARLSRRSRASRAAARSCDRARPQRRLPMTSRRSRRPRTTCGTRTRPRSTGTSTRAR